MQWWGWAGTGKVRWDTLDVDYNSSTDMGVEKQNWVGLRAEDKAEIVFSRTSLTRE